MASFRFNLDKRFLDRESALKAKGLEKEGKSFDKYLNKNETSIYLSITINEKYLKVNTGQKIQPKYYDVKNQRIKQNYIGGLELQIFLERIKNECLKEYRQLLTNNTKHSYNDVKEIMVSIVNPTTIKEKSFMELYEEFYKDHSLKIEHSTAQRYKVTLNALKDYEKAHPKIKLDSIDQNFSDSFSNFLIETRNNTNNTIVKHLKNIKCFMAVCQKNKLIDNNDYKYIKSTEDQSSIFVLTWDEIMNMYSLEIEDKLLSKVRDIFCFQCFTGQRYGDIQSLKWRDIKEEKGKMYWYLYQLKTKNTKPIRIPIMPMANEILMKYQTNNKELHHNVFSAPHNAVQNKKLKELGLKSKLKGEFTTIMKQGFRRIEEVKKRYQKLSTHCARKSFISISIEKGMSISAIQKISGHTTIRAMKPYIELSQQFVEDELLDAWSEQGK